jgi:hypothetical protein
MSAPSRRLIAALVWLAIALLPLRGFAAALMPVGDAPLHGSAAVVEAAQPCHGAEPGHEADADVSHAGCSLCDLCHSSALAAEASDLRWSAMPHGQPLRHGATAIEPHAPDGLFRPPRDRLA